MVIKSILYKNNPNIIKPSAIWPIWPVANFEDYYYNNKTMLSVSLYIQNFLNNNQLIYVTKNINVFWIDENTNNNKQFL